MNPAYQRKMNLAQNSIRHNGWIRGGRARNGKRDLLVPDERRVTRRPCGLRSQNPRPALIGLAIAEATGLRLTTCGEF